MILYFDGGCEPVNPGGVATYGYVIYERIDTEEKRVKSSSGVACEPFSDCSTNNYAEYTALVEGLSYLSGIYKGRVLVRGDSQLVVRQMNGIYSVRSPRIYPLYKKAMELKSSFPSIEFEWIPREMNEEADRLSKAAYYEYLMKHPDVVEKFSSYFATPKQISLLKKLGYKVSRFTSKREASKILSEALRQKDRLF